MPTVDRSKTAEGGEWTTLEWGWNADFVIRIRGPRDAKIKVRYGVGFFGWDRQKQTLDGRTFKQLEIPSVPIPVRAQIKVPDDTRVFYTYTTGSG